MTDKLIVEYKKLLATKEQIESEMLLLPHGYISKKTIRGKQYCYLQHRANGKLVSKYLKAAEAPKVAKQITLLKEYKDLLPKIETRLNELEQAAVLLDKDISRKLLLLKMSLGMDKLDTSQKTNSISFASAMNAIEGIPISQQTESDINEWKNGDKSFVSIFQDTLNRYGFVSEV